MGVLVHLIFGIIGLVLGLWTNSVGILWLGWYLLGGVIVWLLLVLQFHQRRLADEERLDLEALRRERESQIGKDSSIFDDERTGEGDVISARRRLRWLERIFAPIVAILLAVYLIILASLMLFSDSLGAATEGIAGFDHTSEAIVFLLLLLVLQFLLSRYATGMARFGAWRPLRAGGSYSMGTTLMTAGAVIAQLMVYLDQLWGERGLLYVIPVLMGLLGIEIVLNFILDFYRPRAEGEMARPCYDSRLLGLLSEPGGVLESLAHALDYQFGFKVSETWFYILLKRAIVPLLLFQALSIYLLTCIVMIGPEEQALKTRFGRLITEVGQPKPKVFGSGAYLKLPWPIDRFAVRPTKRLHQFVVGSGHGEHDDHDHGPFDLHLWTDAGDFHHEQLLAPMLVERAAVESSAVPVAIFNGKVPVQWRIKPGGLPDFVSKHLEPEELLEKITWRIITQFMASADFRTILSTGRDSAAKQLRTRIQAEADKAELGVEIVTVGLQSIHPPAAVAESYHGVISARYDRDVDVFGAQMEFKGRLSMFCGAAEAAVKVYEAIKGIRQARSARGAIASDGGMDMSLVEVFREVGASGEVEVNLMAAEADAVERVLNAEADASMFSNQIKAFESAPVVYRIRRILELLEEILRNKRKIVNLTVKPVKPQINLEEKLHDIFDADLFGASPSEGQGEK
jgi:regulator of protease activity HflC (stomatin/prohibitin superfamily)